MCSRNNVGPSDHFTEACFFNCVCSLFVYVDISCYHAIFCNEPQSVSRCSRITEVSWAYRKSFSRLKTGSLPTVWKVQLIFREIPKAVKNLEKNCFRKVELVSVRNKQLKNSPSMEAGLHRFQEGNISRFDVIISISPCFLSFYCVIITFCSFQCLSVLL